MYTLSRFNPIRAAAKWWDAKVHVTSTSNLVSQWITQYNLSSAGQPTTGNQPTYSSDGEGPLILFNGNQEYLSAANMQPTHNTGIYLVFQNAEQIGDDTFTAVRPILASSHVDGPFRDDSGGFGMALRYPGNPGIYIKVPSTGTSTSQIIEYSLIHDGFYYIMSLRSNAGAVTAELNNLSIGSATIDKTTGFDLGYLFGGDPSTQDRWFYGGLKAVIWVNFYPNNLLHAQIKDFLYTYYDITI